MAGCLAGCVASFTFVAEAAEALTGKLFARGWESPTPARFRAELAEFERWGVFAGTLITPTRRGPDGVQRECRDAFGHDHWERGEFAEAWPT